MVRVRVRARRIRERKMARKVSKITAGGQILY